MKLKQLFDLYPDIHIKGSQDTEISGISSHSRHIKKGDLFIARKGKNFAGSQFIKDAIALGAVAVLVDQYHADFKNVIQIIHPDPSVLEHELGRRFYGDPSQKLTMIGITGTNGKTTTSYLIKYLLDAEKEQCGLIGTVSWITGAKRYEPTHSTPDALTLRRLLSEIKGSGLTHTVMEVTSHALDQRRVEGVDFHVAVFTNLTQDHLDYHGTMENYREAKSLLFKTLKSSAWAVVNADDPASSYMVQSTQASVLSYGIQNKADLCAHHLQMTPEALCFEAHFHGESAIFHVPLTGRFNVENILAATAVGLLQGLTLEQTANILRSFPGVPGRLERVQNQKKLQLFVDYCHTPDALEKALKTLKQLKSPEARLIVVYGCGGNRDALKRPLMGRIAEQEADICILTTDNPRTEDPLEIARQVLEGCKDPHKTIVELDREKAIQKAISIAQPLDLVLVAGKGHETTQQFADRMIYFDDRQVMRDACNR